jgi:CRISPR-associated protein Cas5d
MAYGIKLKVWGDYASFNRPEMKVERVSYDVMTPSAARGILEAIYWKPEMRWVVDEIHVLNPIRFTSVRRNEINCKIPVHGGTGVSAVMKKGSGRLGISVEEHRQQRAGLMLRDVCYGIAAHIELLKNGNEDHPEVKHLDTFRRRAEKGQYFHHPYLGNREFPAFFELLTDFPPCSEELHGVRDLGYLLHDIIYSPSTRGKIVESNQGRRLNAEPRFFRATLRDGVLSVPPLEEAIA